MLALGWVGVEFALCPLGLRQGLLAGTQGDAVMFRTVGSAAGYVVVAFVVAYINAALLSVLSGVARRIRKQRFVLRGSLDARRPFIAVGALQDLFCLIGPLQPRAPPQLA